MSGFPLRNGRFNFYHWRRFNHHQKMSSYLTKMLSFGGYNEHLELVNHLKQEGYPTSQSLHLLELTANVHSQVAVESYSDNNNHSTIVIIKNIIVLYQ